ncbi:unnamed protein product [Rangifer tarandus platyrhynchus]|uniref:Uncharacterized protein n=1 Tax=Rangifer tarandus platyrhynchus TaxID=3082113 RepID=A0AC59ZR39_RANTA
MSPHLLCCWAGQQAPLNGWDHLRRRHGEGRGNTGLAGMVARPGEGLFQKGRFPHALSLPPQGTDHAQGQLDQGHSRQRVAMHGAPSVWSSSNNRIRRVGKEGVQVPRAGWVLWDPFLPTRCLLVSECGNQGPREARLSPLLPHPSPWPLSSPRNENVRLQPPGKDQHEGMCCPGSSGQDGPAGERAGPQPRSIQPSLGGASGFNGSIS